MCVCVCAVTAQVLAHKSLCQGAFLSYLGFKAKNSPRALFALSGTAQRVRPNNDLFIGTKSMDGQ